MGVSDSNLCSINNCHAWFRETSGFTYSASNWFGRMRSASRNSPLYSGTSSSGIYNLPLSPMTGSSTILVSLVPVTSRSHSPQKKLPGFVPALSLISLPIVPIACTASALGMYPVRSTSKLVRFD
ncbi:hypothetical protein IG631_22883 [Alternaria alternata]|nr:hypothetical protein IG631_22883 [Alternaria alternata]